MSRFIIPASAANDPTRPINRNYLTALGGVGCMGLWRFDLPSLVTQVSGKVTAVANWNTAGEPLALVTGSGVVGGTITDGPFGRDALTVTKVDKTAYAPATAPTTTGPFSIAFVGRVSGITDAGFMNLWGSPNLPAWPALKMAGRGLTWNPADGVSSTYGSQPDQIDIAVIASYDGSSVGTIEVNGVKKTSNTVTAEWTSAVWSISHADFPMAGDVDFVGLWSIDLYNPANSDKLMAAREFVAARMGA